MPREPLRQVPTLDEEPDEDLVARPSKDYVEQKLRRVWQYQHLFARATRRSFESRVYIDLFAGPGACRIEGDGRLLPGSPLLATMIRIPFDRFVFCERDPVNLRALRRRIARESPEAHASAIYFDGDVNERVEDIIAQIPQHTSDHRVISLCFADPESAEDIPFTTTRALAGASRKVRAVDFLYNIPTCLDIRRNLRESYFQEGNDTLGAFLGKRSWRERVDDRVKYARGTIPHFVATELADSMIELEYQPIEERDLSPVTLMEGGRGVRLYHLTVFSRDELALKLWRAGLEWSDEQRTLGV